MVLDSHTIDFSGPESRVQVTKSSVTARVDGRVWPDLGIAVCGALGMRPRRPGPACWLLRRLKRVPLLYTYRTSYDRMCTSNVLTKMSPQPYHRCMRGCLFASCSCQFAGQALHEGSKISIQIISRHPTSTPLIPALPPLSWWAYLIWRQSPTQRDEAVLTTSARPSLAQRTFDSPSPESAIQTS